MVRIAAIEVWLNSSWVTREEADRQQQIVHRADDRADRELPFEAEPQIGQHRQDRHDDAERAALHQFAGDARTDRLDAAELVRVAERLPQLVDRRLLALLAAGLDVEPDGHVAVRARALRFDRAEAQSFGRACAGWRDRRRRSWRATRPACRRRSRCRNSCRR